MSKADEMFKNLGYRKIYAGDTCVSYVDEDYNNIEFANEFKTISIDDNTIYFDLLKAINQKCKELGWLE